MVHLEEAAKALYAFICRSFPYGMPSRAFKGFKSEDLAAYEKIRQRGLKKVSKDFPHLFTWEGTQGYEEVIHAVPNANFGARLSKNRADAVALRFYNEALRDDRVLRHKCENRDLFDITFATWKEGERRAGRNHLGISPSTVIFSLKGQNIVLSLVKENDKNSIIVWAEENFATTPAPPPSRKKLIQDAISRVSLERSEMEKNRNGIEVDSIHFDIESSALSEAVNVGEQLYQDVYIHNKSHHGSVYINVVSTLAERKGVQVEGFPSKEFTLVEGESHYVSVQYKPSCVGFMRCILIVNVESENSAFHPFSIARYISVRAGNPEDEAILKPTSPFQRKARVKDDKKFSHPEKIEQPKSYSYVKFVRPLKKYSISPYWKKALSSKTAENQLIELYMKGNNRSRDEMNYPPMEGFQKNLNLENFSDIFHRLLWAEEHQMKIDIKNYDMDGAVLSKRGIYYSLSIPGLAEGRPSVVRGDLVTVSVWHDKCFQAEVVKVSKEDAFLEFPISFETCFVNGLKVDVRFHFKRLLMRTAHQAVDVEEGHALVDHILFPDAIDNNCNSVTLMKPLNQSIKRIADLNLFNRVLNPEQQAAVLAVLSSVARPSPYIIFGPPGTGKTATLVEAILQTIKAKGADPSSRLLVCAPSNTATDLIVQRLSTYVSPVEMIRIMAYSRDRETVPADVMKYTLYNSAEEGFVMPSIDTIKEKRIVAITLSSGGKLPNAGLVDHFTHVFIDESGHAIEPETLCFLRLLKGSMLNPPAVVLAGDPQQLGPIVRSEVAKAFGLEMSLLERLSKRKAYSILSEPAYAGGQKYDSRLVTKLVRNYRSHPAILKLPNDLFYGGDLKASADHLLSHSLEKWEHLPKNGFPVLFHGVEGQDTREGNSPSWFNSEEAIVVRDYIKLLVDDTRFNKCTPEEIGVVTPYHKQVRKIRSLLGACGYGGCKVGSVEEFQGSERRVIIISTVRSSVKYIDIDHKHRLGFLSSSKRFNVAITRAQALLIVVGNPYSLMQDTYWKKFIKYAFENGGYTGCQFDLKCISDDDNVDDDLCNSLGSLALNDTSQLDHECSESEDDYVVVEDMAWRSEE